MTKKEKSIFAVFTIFIIALIGVIVAVSFNALKSSAKEPQTLPMVDDSAVSNVIGIDEAKNIALTHCNQQNNPDITFTTQKFDYENNQRIYEFEFNDGVNKYDYDISADSGSIINYSIEMLNDD